MDIVDVEQLHSSIPQVRHSNIRYSTPKVPDGRIQQQEEPLVNLELNTVLPAHQLASFSFHFRYDRFTFGTDTTPHLVARQIRRWSPYIHIKYHHFRSIQEPNLEDFNNLTFDFTIDYNTSGRSNAAI